MREKSNSAPVERSKPGPVVGWRNGEFLYSAGNGTMMNALGIIIDDSSEEIGTNKVVSEVEPDNYEDKI